MEGGEEGIEPPDEPSDEIKKKGEWIAEWLDELCPYYMFLGVRCEDFWHGDYTKFKYYVKAHNMQRQRKSEEMWLQGLYVYHAFDVVVGNALRKKGAKARQYREEPLRVVPMTEAEKQAKAEKERQKTIAYFNRLAEKWGTDKV